MSTGSFAASAQPALIIHFQGICAFLRNQQSLQNTTEVTTIFVAGERANENPKLCAHSPVLVFQTSDFIASTGQVTHTSALVPNASDHCPGLGLWPLAGRDIRISGATPGGLKLDSSFGATADFDQLFPSGNGAASSQCLDPQPPSDRLVAGRFFLSSGLLSASAFVGDTGLPNDQWVFDDENKHPTTGTPVKFAQEIQYEYLPSIMPKAVMIEAGPMGSSPTETLILSTGARVAISQLCPIDQPVDDERDFLAFYAILTNKVSPRLIPHRLRQGGIRIGVSACPPATTFIGA